MKFNLEIFKEEISKKIGIKKELINENSNLLVDLKLDSIDAMDLIMELENKYDITFEDSKIPELKKVSDLIDYVNFLLGEK